MNTYRLTFEVEAANEEEGRKAIIARLNAGGEEDMLETAPFADEEEKQNG